MSLPILRDHARAIFRAGLDAVEPGAAVRKAVEVEAGCLRVGDRSVPLDGPGSIRIVGMGKASAAMAAGPWEAPSIDVSTGC